MNKVYPSREAAIADGVHPDHVRERHVATLTPAQRIRLGVRSKPRVPKPAVDAKHQRYLEKKRRMKEGNCKANRR